MLYVSQQEGDLVAGEKVLIVEDERDIAQLMVTMMQSSGYQTIVAYDGVEGLNLALRERPDLILLDLRLPKMGGMQVLHDLREQQVSVPVVAVTAWRSEELVIEALRLGVKDYVKKPFALKELLEVAERALTEGRLRRERDALTEQLLISNQELEQRARNLMLINRISTTLTSSLSLDAYEILNLTVQHMVEISGVDYGSVLILEQDGKHGLIVAEHPTHQLADLRLSLPRVPSVQRALEQGTPYMIEDAANHPFLEDSQEQISSLEIRSLLLVPLVAWDEMIGILFLASLGQPRTFSDEERELYQTVASQAAVVVANARLVQDIQVQRRALARKSQELTEESSKLDAIINNVTDGLVVTDPNERIILSNPAFREMAGQSPTRSLRGRLLTESSHAAGLQPLVAQALQEPDQVFTENLELPNGQVLKTSATALHLPPPLLEPERGEQIAGVVTILRDITSEVEVDRMKTDFVSAVSHELRSPLTSILGFASLIGRDFRRWIAARVTTDKKTRQVADRILENLAIIEDESLRLTRLINDLLDVAKMEAGQAEWPVAKTDLVDVIQSAVIATTAQAQENGLSIQVYLPPDGLPPVWGNQDRLVQVITNLLSNAVKFTEQGQIEVRGWELDVRGGTLHSRGPAPSPYGPTVRLGLRAEPQAEDSKSTAIEDTLADLQFSEGEWVVVSVADTGVGMQAREIPRLFKKFTQVGDMLTGRPHGTGLGLSICKGIVEYHGGHIWVRSELGKGSIFSFALPMMLFQEEAPEEVGLPVVRETTSPAPSENTSGAESVTHASRS